MVHYASSSSVVSSVGLGESFSNSRSTMIVVIRTGPVDVSKKTKGSHTRSEMFAVRVGISLHAPKLCANHFGQHVLLIALNYRQAALKNIIYSYHERDSSPSLALTGKLIFHHDSNGAHSVALRGQDLLNQSPPGLRVCYN